MEKIWGFEDVALDILAGWMGRLMRDMEHGVLPGN
jgi:hypothetical protein